MKAVHLVAAVLLGRSRSSRSSADRRALRRTARDVDRFDPYDRAWLRGAPRAARRPGRFNAGQKLNVVVVCAAWLLFGVSGAFLYLGERDTSLRLPGTIALHDFSTLAAGRSRRGPRL